MPFTTLPTSAYTTLDATKLTGNLPALNGSSLTNISAGKLGQRYGDPKDSVMSGADIIIVGSGIHGQSDRVAAAKAYANASWNAILERGK